MRCSGLKKKKRKSVFMFFFNTHFVNLLACQVAQFNCFVITLPDSMSTLHCAGEILKVSFISMVRPTVHNNPEN